MPNSWYEPIDEEHNNRHRKKKKKKRFRIEYRWTGECRFPWQSNNWKPYYTSYVTEKSRDQALAHLQRKAASAKKVTEYFAYHKYFEYRAARLFEKGD